VKNEGNPRRCGAKTRGPRAGRTCLSWPVHGFERCRMHGARSGRPQGSGRYSKSSLEERRLVRELLRQAKETVLSIRRNVEAPPRQAKGA
jgi:hypothetical protein